MSDAQTRIAAMMADRKNTRLALATALAERNAQLEVARTAYRELRDAYRSLKAQVEAAPPVRVAKPLVAAPIVTRFTKADGTVWEKTRTGRVATLKQVTA